MTRPLIEVADVIRLHGDAFLDEFGTRLTPEQRRVLHDLARCRTAALGGHVEQCDQCGHQQIAYNSCRNRHCPKCQATEAARWVEARASALLPVEYFHVVFTLPAVLNSIALHNPRVVYDRLFHAASATLLRVAADPKHLGARIGFSVVLHTWGRTLQYHPHVHCVVPGGGLSLDGAQWVACPKGFFVPVRVLSRVFRGKFLEGLQADFARGRLVVPSEHADAESFHRLLEAATHTEWVVYAKPPFGGPEAVLKYLARYTHRVAISNQRLVTLENGWVSFHYKDSANEGRQRTMTLEASEFLRRFVQHVLPSGFVRIRHYGFLANCCREEQLARCRQLLGSVTPEPTEAQAHEAPSCEVMNVPSGVVCAVCGRGRMVVIRELSPASKGRSGTTGAELCTTFDTS